MTSPIASTTAATTTAATTSSTTSTSTDNTQLSSDAFLQLLVAQLKYQDPSKPVDTSQFMNETATLTQVQTMESNAKTMTELLQAQQSQTASSMVGRTVKYLDSAGATQTGVVSAATISSTPPTLRIGTDDIDLSNIQQVISTAS
jgi:flagellar basal-body rod modification protein FlgD